MADLNKMMIGLVRDRPVLWDKGSMDYRDRAMRDAAWLEIYRAMEPNYDTLEYEIRTQIGHSITKKWNNIRDAYVKYLKNDKYSNTSRNRNRPYIYHEDMKFLDPTYGPGRTDNISNTQTSADETSNEKDDTSFLQSVFVGIDEEDSFETGESSKKKQKIQESHEEESNTPEQNMANVIATFMLRDNSEDMSFFKSLLPSVVKLSEDAKFEFRIRTMKLLKELRKKDDHDAKVKCEFLEEEYL